MKRVFLIYFLCSLSLALWAIPAIPLPICVTLADGRTIEVCLKGDEYDHYYTLLDGTPIRLEDGKVFEDETVALRRNMKRAPQAVEANDFVLQGSPKALVILMEYADLSFVTPNPQQAFSNMLNQSGYSDNRGTGSVRDYYTASSNGAFTPIFDVYGPYTAENKMSYYGENAANGNDKRVGTLVREACEAVAAEGVDFSQYDNDNDGEVDNIFIYYAGHNEAEGASANTIWPHRYAIYPVVQLNGYRFSSYLCTSELTGSKGSAMAGIGTFCHEFGHVLGLPDLYNTVSSQTYTVGSWDLMCTGSYNNNGRTPPTLSAFERFMLGWLTPEQITKPKGCRLLPIETHNTAYLIAETEHNLGTFEPSPNEYFLLENRQRVGWDAGIDALPGVGLLVSHITFNRTSWDNNTFNNSRILGYDIVEAYTTNPSSSLPSDTYPGTGGITFMLPTLNNNTKLYERQLVGITQLADNSIIFQCGQNGESGFMVTPQYIDPIVTTYDKGPVEYKTADLDIQGMQIKDSVVEISVTNSYFEFSIDNGQTWITHQKSLVDTVEKDSSYSRQLLIRHKPTRRNCTPVSGILNITTRNADDLQMSQLRLEGIAPRPTYINTPTNLVASDIMPTSCKISWDQQEDAELYFATVYNKLPDISTSTQDFENINNEDDVKAIGWEMNVFDFTMLDRYDGQRALYLTQTNQYVQTEIYKEVVTNLQFWISNSYDNETTGELRLCAKNASGEWEDIQTLITKRSTKNLMCEYDFAKEKKYIQFRLEYTQHGKEGGLFLDALTATLPSTINFLYQGDERVIYAPTANLVLSDLKWGETYYVQIQAYEEKGCEPHFTEWSQPLVVTPAVNLDTTEAVIFGATKENQLTVVRYDNYLRVYLEKVLDTGGGKLCLFNQIGECIDIIPVLEGEATVTISAEYLNSGVYVVKYLPNDSRMRRKGLWGKFIW